MNSSRKQDICGFHYQSDVGKCEFYCNFCQYQCSEKDTFLHHLDSHVFECVNCDFFCFNQISMFCHQQQCDAFSFNIEGFFLCTLLQNSIVTTSVENVRTDIDSASSNSRHNCKLKSEINSNSHLIENCASKIDLPVEDVSSDVVSQCNVKLEIEAIEASHLVSDCDKNEYFNEHSGVEKTSSHKQLLGNDFIAAFINVKKEKMANCDGHASTGLSVEAGNYDKYSSDATAIQGLLVSFNFNKAKM